MMTAVKNLSVKSGYAFGALVSAIPGMPRVAFASDDGTGAPDAAAIAAAAAEKAAADKIAEKTAADEAAAKKELEDAEAAAAALEDDTKDAAALKLEKAKLLREVMDKKTKLKDLEKKASDATEALKAYDGIDPAKVRELLKKEADAEKASAEAKGDFDRVKAMMADEHKKEVDALKKQIEDSARAVAVASETINTLTVGNDFNGSSFIRENMTLSPSKARALYGSHFEVVDGKTVAYDKPAGKANRTMMVDASGQPLRFDDAFKRIIDADPDKDTLLKAKINPGANSNSNGQKPVEKNADAGLFGKSRIAASLAKAK